MAMWASVLQMAENTGRSVGVVRQQCFASLAMAGGHVSGRVKRRPVLYWLRHLVELSHSLEPFGNVTALVGHTVQAQILCNRFGLVRKVCMALRNISSVTHLQRT